VPRFSANLGFLFTERPFLERFAAAASAGFRGVEFADPYAHPPDEIAVRLQEHGLECALFNLPMGDRAKGDMGLGCLPDRVEEFNDGLALAADIARRLGCARVNCMAGRAPEGADPTELRATLVANLKRAARALARVGVTVCLEALNTVDCPGFFVSGSQQAADLLRDVAEDNVRLQFDCYHMQVMEGDLHASLTRLFPLIGHIQFADAPGRHEPGTGDIDHDRLFAHLDALGYGGWVGAEYRPSRRTEETLGWKRDRYL
jgi:hydroxypyruvate isomerase